MHSRMDAKFILCESVTMKASKAGPTKKEGPKSSLHFHDCNRPSTVSAWWISTKAWLPVYIALVDV